jgi:hypothetical protein
VLLGSKKKSLPKPHLQPNISKTTNKFHRNEVAEGTHASELQNDTQVKAPAFKIFGQNVKRPLLADIDRV